MVVFPLTASVSHSGRRQGHQLRWERERTIERLWMKLWSRVSESGEVNAQEKYTGWPSNVGSPGRKVLLSRFLADLAFYFNSVN